MDFNEAIDILNSRIFFKKNPSLENMREILNIFSNPHEKIKFIHIGGTNGKGSVCNLISSILIEFDLNVGLYTSPYVECFEERIQINNKKISKDDFSFIMDEVVSKLKLENVFDKITYFELLTLVMFKYFEKNKVDIGVIEVGIGGRYDSTNVIMPILSVINSISYDHMDILGDSIEEIAYDKGGIIKDNIPVVVYPSSYKEAVDILRQISDKKKSKFIFKSKEKILNSIDEYRVIEKKNSQIFKIKIRDYEYSLNLKLLGMHQLLNTYVAIRSSLEVLNILDICIQKEKIEIGVGKVDIKGRFQVVKQDPYVILDGAHNIDSIKKLRENILNLEYENLIIVFGILKSKDYREIIKALEGFNFEKIIITKGSNSKFLDPCELEKEFDNGFKDKLVIIDDLSLAYKKALELSSKKDLILITGSFYLLSEVIKYF